MISCTIVTPNGLFKKLETSILNIKTIEGERGLLTNHVPLVAILDIGKLITVEDGERKEYAVSGGVIYFVNNEAKILCEAIEFKDEIDIERAIRAKDRAINYLNSKDPNVDLKRAELALRRAMNRMNVKNGNL